MNFSNIDPRLICCWRLSKIEAATAYSFLFPIANEEESEQHASQVGKMSYTAHGAADTEQQFEETVEDDKIFSLDGNGDKYKPSNASWPEQSLHERLFLLRFANWQ